MVSPLLKQQRFPATSPLLSLVFFLRKCMKMFAAATVSLCHHYLRKSVGTGSTITCGTGLASKWPTLSLPFHPFGGFGLNRSVRRLAWANVPGEIVHSLNLPSPYSVISCSVKIPIVCGRLKINFIKTVRKLHIPLNKSKSSMMR